MDTQVLSFSDPLQAVGPCPWGADDNGEPTPGGIGARHESVQSLELPAGAVLCAAELSVLGGEFLYDDHMFVLFNDIVVLSSVDVSGYLAERRGLLVYDWERLREQPASDQVYCPGAESICSLPPQGVLGTEVPRLGLDNATVRQLADLAAPAGRHDFTVVVSGDDDETADCTHSDFELEVTFEYVVP